MITKERLKELIEQGATIYKISRENFIAGASDLLKIDKIPSGLYSQEISDRIGQEPDYDLLFETEEDARWELEMTATRTETLKLANYTDFENENGDRVFYHKGTTYELSLWWASDNTKIIRVTWRCKDGFGWLFEEPLTKENYIEACKVCLRLFKGEEV